MDPGGTWVNITCYLRKIHGGGKIYVLYAGLFSKAHGFDKHVEWR